MIFEMRLTEDTVAVVAWLVEIFETDFELTRDEAIKKTKAWLTVKNPHFGGISPLMLINTGRAHKVLKFILSRDEF